MKYVTLDPKKAAAIQRRHPWIFSGAISSKPEQLEDGDIVQVLAKDGMHLATGHWHFGSIAVRILSFEPTQLDRDFWTKRLKAARSLRGSIGLPAPGLTDAYRLVHAEGDHLPGLVIDIYGRTAVIQCHSIGMYRQIEDITAALHTLMGDELTAIYDKSRETLPQLFASELENHYRWGIAGPGQILENGAAFRVDWEKGQKTGFFLDQRANRMMLSRFAKGKKVLNAFSYSGGFSVYALRAGAKLVHSVDSSAHAMEWCEENVEINGPFEAEHEGFVTGVLEFLKDAPESYDLMVVDPPAFAKNINKRHQAVQGYKRLNALALQKIQKGGILFTFSCSQVVDRKLFYDTITAAAIETGRSVRVLHHLSQPADHPVDLFHPEGSYLKGLVLKVD